MRLTFRHRLMLLLLAVVLSCAQVGAIAASADAPTGTGAQDAITDILVQFQPSTLTADGLSPHDRQLLTAAGAGEILGSLGAPGAVRVAVQPGYRLDGVVAALRSLPEILSAEPNRPISLSEPIARLQAETILGNLDWDLSAIDAERAWSFGEGEGVVVAVLDTGVSASHPDLTGRVLPGWNFIQNTDDTADDTGHGTYVAGLIAGARGTAGVMGVAPGVSILPVKILDSSGTGSTASFVAGINYAVEAGARVINISASGTSDSPALEAALANAEARGVVVVASAGNNGIEESLYPAAVPTVLDVSATDQNNARAGFSSFGPDVDIAAPGVDIRSAWWSTSGGDGHATASGSSASVPLVAGAAAIVAGLRPDLSAAGIRAILTESAKDIESPGIDAATGYGLLDAYAAARLADEPVNPQSAELLPVLSGDGWHLKLAADGFQPYEPLDIWTDAGNGYRVIRGLAADENGAIATDLGPEWHFPSGAMAAFAAGSISERTAVARRTIDPVPVSEPFQPVPASDSTPDRFYFPETGHTLAYGFKAFWESHGGLAIFGYPISEEFVESNPDTGQRYTVQYFERNRFEYHPEFAGTPWEISLGRLGTQTAPQVFPTSAATNVSDLLYFSATQHTLTGPFRDYWEQHGGLALFGYPISEPFEQGGLLVQYFERSRFEYHPELPPNARVLLSRLGSDLARANGYLH